MKGVVLANHPLRQTAPTFTREQSLELVSVTNQPILFHVLDRLREAEIEDVTLVVDPEGGEEVRDAVHDGSRWGLRISYVPRPHLGVLDAARAVRQAGGDGPLLVHPANGILMAPLGPLVRQFRRERLEALLPLDTGGKRAAKINGPDVEHLLSIRSAEQPGVLEEGVFIFGCLALDAAVEAIPSWRGRPELSDVVHALVERGARVQARPMSAWWSYQGDTRELLEGNRLLLDRLIDDRAAASISDSVVEGRVAIDPSARIESSTIRGPAIIGPGARISDAYIGPYTSVGASVLIQGAEVENSVIMDNAQLRDLGARIADSVIGEDVIVNRDFTLPRIIELSVARGSTATLG